MARNENRRLSPATLAEDEETLNALKKIQGYTSSNSDYSVEAIEQSQNRMRESQAKEDQGIAALATLRDIATRDEWDRHKRILGAKDQIRAQFGKDSLQIQEIGLKRPSEYKPRRPKAKPTTK